jgi:serine/threonine-protein kinase
MADLLVPAGGAFAGRYVIEGELGHGATAAVYLARDLKHGRHVALKVLRPDLAASLESARFLREIRLLARLQHPHILPLFDSGEHDGALFYVMPRVEGETLGQRLRRDGQVAVGEALRITREVADALAYAHAHDVVHRDIKPDNILLDGTHALVADFGIARAVHRAVDSGDRITSAGLAIGTPAYMSPEQASGEREVEGRSDIYSLACVLYEMLAGRYPFQGPSLQSMIARRFAGPPPPVSTLREGVPREVDEALTRALQPAPEDRFQTVREFCEALPPPTAETAPVHARRVRRWPFVVAAVMLVIAVLLGVRECRPPSAGVVTYGVRGRTLIVSPAIPAGRGRSVPYSPSELSGPPGEAAVS